MSLPAVTVSIVITAFNIAEWIEECLDSIIAQTFTDFECIVVDDCSRDITPDIVDAYAKKDTRIRLVKHDRNMGIGYTRHELFTMGSGEYLWQIDGDDCIPPNALETLYSIAKYDGCDIVRGNYKMLYGNEVKNATNPTSESITRSSLSKMPILLRFTGGIWLNLYRKKFIDSLVFPDTNGYDVGQDAVLNSFTFTQAKSISTTTEITYFYRVRAKSVTTTSPKAKNYLSEAKSHVAVFDIYNDFPISQIHFALYPSRFRYSFVQKALSHAESSYVFLVIAELKKIYSKWVPEIAYFIHSKSDLHLDWNKEKDPRIMEFVLRLYFQQEREIYNWLYSNYS